MSGMSGMCDVTRYQSDTKSLLFLSICVHIVLFSAQRSFVFKHLCKYCNGEGFILLTRGYGFIGGVYQPPFDTLKIGASTNDIKLKLYM